MEAKDFLSSGKRDKMEIMAAAIVMAQKPNLFSHIMNRSAISREMLKSYLEYMTRKRLIENDAVVRKGNKSLLVYRATEKGLLFLKTYCDMLRLLYGEDFLRNRQNLVAVSLRYCKKLE